MINNSQARVVNKVLDNRLSVIIENIFQVLQRNTRLPWNPFCFEKDLTKTDAKVFKATMAHILATAAKAISKIVSAKTQIADVLRTLVIFSRKHWSYFLKEQLCTKKILSQKPKKKQISLKSVLFFSRV